MMADKRPWWILGGLVALNLVLKLWHLTAAEIAMDEPFTIFYASGSVADIFDMLRTENHPPLHFLFMHAWVKWFGIDPWMVRLPSVIFSTLAMVYVFRLGKMFSLHVAVVGALLFSFSSYHMYFAHEARVYPLFAMLAAMTLYYGWKTFANGRGAHQWWFGISAGLLLNAHFFGAFVLLMLGVTAWMYRARWQDWIRPVLLSALVAIVLVAPYLTMVIYRLGEATEGGTWLKESTDPDGLYNMLWRFTNKPVITVATIGLLAVSIVMYLRQRMTRDVWMLYLWFFVPFILMYVLSFKLPMFLDRYLIHTSIPFYLMIPLAVQSIPLKMPMQWVVSGMLVLGMLFTLDLSPDHERQLKEVTTEVEDAVAQGTPVVISPTWAGLRVGYHFDREGYGDPNYLQHQLREKGVWSVDDSTGMRVELRSMDRALLVDGGSDADLIHNIKTAFYHRFGDPHTVVEFKVYKLYYYGARE